MSPTETTTLRIPSALRDDIARIADERGSTMLDVVTEAVERLRREQWWADVHQTLDRMTDADAATARAELVGLDGAAADGLDRD